MPQIDASLSTGLPGWDKWAEVIRVVDAADLPPGRQFAINANPLKQHVVCYVSDQQALAPESLGQPAIPGDLPT